VRDCTSVQSGHNGSETSTGESTPPTHKASKVGESRSSEVRTIPILQLNSCACLHGPALQAKPSDCPTELSHCPCLVGGLGDRIV